MDLEERRWKRHDSLAQASEALVSRIVATDALLYGVAALSVASAALFAVVKNDGVVTVALVVPLLLALRGVRRAVATSRSRSEVEFLVEGLDSSQNLAEAIELLGRHYTRNHAALKVKEADLRLSSRSWLVVVIAGMTFPYLLVVLSLAAWKKAW